MKFIVYLIQETLLLRNLKIKENNGGLRFSQMGLFRQTANLLTFTPLPTGAVLVFKERRKTWLLLCKILSKVLYLVSIGYSKQVSVNTICPRKALLGIHL